MRRPRLHRPDVDHVSAPPAHPFLTTLRALILSAVTVGRMLTPVVALHSTVWAPAPPQMLENVQHSQSGQIVCTPSPCTRWQRCQGAVCSKVRTLDCFASCASDRNAGRGGAVAAAGIRLHRLGTDGAQRLAMAVWMSRQPAMWYMDHSNDAIPPLCGAGSYTG